jgi:hypothetical protein
MMMFRTSQPGSVFRKIPFSLEKCRSDVTRSLFIPRVVDIGGRLVKQRFVEVHDTEINICVRVKSLYLCVHISGTFWRPWYWQRFKCRNDSSGRKRNDHSFYFSPWAGRARLNNNRIPFRESDTWRWHWILW